VLLARGQSLRTLYFSFGEVKLPNNFAYKNLKTKEKCPKLKQNIIKNTKISKNKNETNLRKNIKI